MFLETHFIYFGKGGVGGYFVPDHPNTEQILVPTAPDLPPSSTPLIIKLSEHALASCSLTTLTCYKLVIGDSVWTPLADLPFIFNSISFGYMDFGDEKLSLSGEGRLFFCQSWYFKN